jgi:preprotein translocase subunit SecB
VSDARPLMRLERVYLKDASFESPGSPGVFSATWQPDISLEINTRSQKLGDERYEVVLTATVKASTEDRVAFIAEVQQAALFQMRGLEQAVLHRTLGTVCPTTLFPYVREAVDSLVVRGGFPALQLAPMNFEAAYEEALKQARSSAVPH